LEVSVFLNGIRLHVRCGVYDEERSLGVQLKVSVKVTAEEFVDYQELYAAVVETASSREFRFLEEFAQELVNRIVKRWNARLVIIKIIKLNVPFQHSFEEAGVEVVWRRSDGSGRRNQV